MRTHPAMTRRRAAAWWLLTFVMLSLVFTTNLLHSSALPRILGTYPTEPVNSAPYFDGVSEALIQNPIDLRFSGLDSQLSDFLFTVRSGNAADPRIFDIQHPERFAPEWRPSRAELLRPGYYRSQIGLQGRLYAAASEAMGLDRPRTFALLRGFSAAMLAAMLAVLVTGIAACWGRTAGLAALGFCVFATGFNLFAPRLYWVTFVHVGPTAVAALLASGLPGRGRTAHAAAFAAMALLFVAKFASGYEFITVTIAAATIPFFLSFAAGRIPMKTLILYAAAAVATGIAAFGVTLGIYDMLFRAGFGTSGLAYLATRTGETSGLPLMGPLGSPLQIAKVAVINAADIGGYGIPNFIVLAAGLPFAFVAARALARRRFEDERTRIAIAVAAALLASTSWLLLQFPHVSFHPRYATILVAFPYGLVLAASLGRLWHLRRLAGGVR